MADLKYTVDIDTRGATAALGGLKKAVGAAVAAIAVDKMIDFGRAIADATAKFQNYTNSLRLITSTQQELSDTMEALTAAAIANRASFGDTVDLYTKLTLATESLGKSQDEILNVTTKFQQALAISGADAGTAAGAIRQFGQAMASGTVRGDEFNSIVEALGPALSIMARESGINVGQLRQMSQAGELTAETFFNMVASSKALTAAFNQMNPTLDQLESQLGDAFDRALIKTGEITGLTQGYENAIKRLTRAFDEFAQTEGALVNESDAAVYRKATEGVVSYQAAIDELAARLESETDWNPWTGEGRTEAEVRALEGMATQLSILKIEAEAAAREMEAVAKAEQEQKTALNATLAPFREYIAQAEKYAETDFRSELEKANDRIREAQTVIEQLAIAQEAANGGIANFETLLQAAQNELAAATARVEELRAKSKDLSDEDSFAKFYDGIIERANDANQKVINTQLAISRLDEELAAGRISLDTYAFAMDMLSDKFETSGEKAEELERKLKQLSESTKDAVDAIDARIQQSAEAAELSGLQGLEQQLRAIELEELRLAEAAKERVRAQSEGLDSSQIEASLNAIDERTRAAIEARQADARIIENNLERFRQAKEEETRITREAERVKAQAAEEAKKAAERAAETFEKGWTRAYESYADEATNAAKAAERIFNKTTKGMEDAIVNFAKTGKFEFKDLVATILEELLRSQIQQLIASTFGAFGAGGGSGGLSSLFGGFFANGGTLGAGKFGVVGERGPELISGPANITPLDNFGGGTQVIYNINAVDAPSFKSMIARDPGFIHAVAQQGARKVPLRR